MKTTIKLLFLSITVLLSACSVNDVAVIKRKYNNGYHFSFANKKAKQNKISTVAKKQKISLKSSKTASIESVEKADNKINKNKESSVPNIFDAPKTSKSTVNNTVYSKTLKEKIKNRRIAKIKKKFENINSKDVDDKTILLIILSLFPILALVAIYIKEGETITNNFWIDLVLHFVFLYWLYALLVVLDIIDFS